jgi:glycosyltransferase involved in cell wall biosynthesis
MTSPASLPLVSILIPTHNRPDYLELALKSALAQTYGNLEIVISDNSDDEASQERLAPYIQAHANVKCVRSPGATATQNARVCLEHATGAYVNYLMDDDIHLPDKIERMMHYFLTIPGIGLVTSSRQLIDHLGNFLPAAPATQRLVEVDSRIEGRALGDIVLSNGRNVIGEPTTVLLRREDIEAGFGQFCGRQYFALSDVATWLSILATRDCVYIPEALSHFRLHPEQDQRNIAVVVNAQIEWMQLIIDSHLKGLFLVDRTALRERLPALLVSFLNFLETNQAQIRESTVDLGAVQEIFRQAVGILLTDGEVAV